LDYWKKTSVIGVFIAMRWKVGSPYEGEDRRMLVGHTILTRFADFDYCGEKASAEFNDKNDKNNFFESVGALPPLTLEIADKLRKLNNESAFNLIADSAKQMKWK